MRGVAWLALVGGSLPTTIGALGVNSGRVVSSDAVRESIAGRKRFRNWRPGDAAAGIDS